jgi:hypothetical protein
MKLLSIALESFLAREGIGDETETAVYETFLSGRDLSVSMDDIDTDTLENFVVSLLDNLPMVSLVCLYNQLEWENDLQDKYWSMTFTCGASVITKDACFEWGEIETIKL